MNETQTYESLTDELAELRLQLQEANETIEAIRTGQVDALVVKKGEDHHLYTLKSADQTYRVFIEKMKEGAVTLNKEGIILYSNSQFATMVNEPLGKVIGLYFHDFISPDFRDEFNHLFEKGWKSDSKGEIELCNDNNGSILFLLSFTSLQLDEGQALSIILTDLSQQKETERQLKQKNAQLEEARVEATKISEHLEELVKERTHELFLSREHFRSLADNIPVIVWTSRPDGSPDYFNQKWHDYTGLTLEQSLNGGSRTLIHPDDLMPTVNAWKDAIAKQTRFEFEYRIKRIADGEYRWHLSKGEPLKDEDGSLLAWFGTSTDIEDQKKEIERKDEFIGVASHELKTPLTSLKGYLQLMELQQDLPEHISRYIGKANDSVNKLQHLINDLLDVSKIQAGKLKFEMELLDLADILRVGVDNSVHMFPSYHFTSDIADNIRVCGNGERIEQVFMNLISNAVKYSPDNKNIVISATITDDMVKVSVTDGGIGMAKVHQEKIFERFYRVDNSNLFTSGLGMGLYISVQIIKEHRGRMDVKSVQGKGSTISFLLPLAAG